jgi:hypothetical protein
MGIISVLFIFVMHYSLLCYLGMLLFWCITFNGAKTLFLAVQVGLLVGRTSGGLLDQFVMFWLCKRSQTRII